MARGVEEEEWGMGAGGRGEVEPVTVLLGPAEVREDTDVIPDDTVLPTSPREEGEVDGIPPPTPP